MKLLRKDVLKWIKALSDGSYKKGTGRLVSVDGTKFCCLGVWADMHGATWDEAKLFNGETDALIPIPKGRVKQTEAQQKSGAYLKDPLLSRGLNAVVQRELANENDGSKRGFKPVIAYIKKNVLPLAK